MKQLADQSPLCDAGTQSRFVFSFNEVEEQRLIKVHFIVKHENLISSYLQEANVQFIGAHTMIAATANDQPTNSLHRLYYRLENGISFPTSEKEDDLEISDKA